MQRQSSISAGLNLRNFGGQIILVDRGASEPESLRSLASSGMKVDAIRAKAEVGADPAGDVVDRQFADALDAADPVVNGSMQVIEGAAGRQGMAGQRVCGAPKGVARDAALMGMPLPGGERGQRGGADGRVQAAVAGPMSAFVFGSRAIVTAIGADDCRQGLQMGLRGISAWRTRRRRAGYTAGRTRHPVTTCPIFRSHLKPLHH